MKVTNYHIIGDIHGMADKLEQLLQHLGYEQKDGVYQRPGAKVVFLGDFIDRGHQQRRVIDIVRPMIKEEHAFAVMGNHEFNAICYHTLHPETEDPLRPHSEHNTEQHEAFLKEYALHDEETREVIKWFKKLPVYLEVKDPDDGKILFRAIHACWSQEIVDRTPQYLKKDDILEAATKGSPTYDDIEVLLKGPEVPLPKGGSFRDKSGVVRKNIRIKWWSSSSNSTYRDLAMAPEDEERNISTDKVADAKNCYGYPEDAPPVFFGHYWLTGEPIIIRKNLACLDYSAGMDGALVAYHWRNRGSAGNKLSNRNFSFDCAEEMQRLKQRILDNRTGYARIWRGAEVIITVDPIPKHHEAHPNDILVITYSKELAIKLSWLFVGIRDAMSSYIDFRNKYYFYATLAEAAIHAIEEKADQQTCLLAVWEQAEAHRLGWWQAEIKEQIMQKRNSPDSLMNPEENSPFKDNPLLDHMLRYLASFDIQFTEPAYGDPLKSREIVMTYEASTALPVLEAYCNLNNIPFTRPAGPVRMIDLSKAERLEQLLAQYRDNDWITNIPVPPDLIREQERAYSLRNITNYRIIGKTNVGWKMEAQFSDECNVNLGLISSTWSKTDKPNQFQLYFQSEDAMNALIAELQSLLS